MTPSDKILISGMECLAAIGVPEEERAAKQCLIIDVEFVADTRMAASSDSIKDTVDYGMVARTVAEVCGSQPFHLIETVAERIAGRVMERFPIAQVRVLVRKISPLAEPRAAYVSVEIVRSLGSL